MMVNNRSGGEGWSEVLKLLQKKYGQKNLHKVTKLFYSGLPEYSWMNDKYKDDVKEKIEGLENNSVISVTNTEKNNVRETYLYISSIVKHLIWNKNDKCMMFDFFNIISILTKFNLSGLNEVMGMFDTLTCIAITGIKYGDIFDKNLEVFLILLNNLLNSRINKKIIIGFEYIERNKIEEAYGELYDFFKQGDIIILK